MKLKKITGNLLNSKVTFPDHLTFKKKIKKNLFAPIKDIPSLVLP